MRLLRSIAAVAVALAPATVATAWHGKGHDLASRAAVAATESQMPAFFAAGVDAIANVSQDNDAFTRPIAPPELHAAEAPEHYFDIELLGGKAVPKDRYEFIEFCCRNGLRPDKVGLLPYAITEWTQRLTVALAEHRRWPNDPAIRAKCLVYAGLLAHYAADACQPLHLTIDWDGRALPDGSSPRTGIHLRVDSLPNGLRIAPRDLAGGLKVAAFDKVMDATLAEFQRTRSHIDRVYQLEPQLPPADGDQPLPPEVAEFTTERMKAAAAFTACLYLTAWRDSAKLELPPWHRARTMPPAATQPAEAAPIEALREGTFRPTRATINR